MLQRLTPVVKNLLILNVIVFVAVNLLNPHWLQYIMLWKVDLIFDRVNFLDQPFGDSPFKPFQIISHFFTHGSIMHIAFNMLALVFLGVAVEMVFRSRRFLEFYMFTGIVSGIFIIFLDPSPYPVVGASGALFGVLVAFAYYFPKEKIYLMFIPFGFEAKKFTIGIGVISAVLVGIEYFTGKSMGGISHFGHLAGMIAALIYIFAGKLIKIKPRN